MGLKVAVFIILTWAVKRVNFDYAAPAISCIFPSAQEGQEATLTCMFQNIKKSSKQTVSVNAKLARTGIFHSVLTLQDPTSKPPTPNVSISQSADGNNWNVSIRYLKATKRDEGEYGCQLVSPGTPKSQSCQFTLGDSPDFVTASTQDEKGPRTTDETPKLSTGDSPDFETTSTPDEKGPHTIDETPKLSTEKALKKGNGGLDGGAIAGIVFAVLWIIAVAVFLVWYCKYWPKKLNKEKDKDQVKAVYTHGGGNGSAEPTTSSEQETDQLLGVTGDGDFNGVDTQAIGSGAERQRSTPDRERHSPKTGQIGVIPSGKTSVEVHSSSMDTNRPATISGDTAGTVGLPAPGGHDGPVAGKTIQKPSEEVSGDGSINDVDTQTIGATPSGETSGAHGQTTPGRERHSPKTGQIDVNPSGKDCHQEDLRLPLDQSPTQNSLNGDVTAGTPDSGCLLDTVTEQNLREANKKVENLKQLCDTQAVLIDSLTKQLKKKKDKLEKREKELQEEKKYSHTIVAESKVLRKEVEDLQKQLQEAVDRKDEICTIQEKYIHYLEKQLNEKNQVADLKEQLAREQAKNRPKDWSVDEVEGGDAEGLLHDMGCHPQRKVGGGRNVQPFPSGNQSSVSKLSEDNKPVQTETIGAAQVTIQSGTTMNSSLPLHRQRSHSPASASPDVKINRPQKPLTSVADSAGSHVSVESEEASGFQTSAEVHMAPEANPTAALTHQQSSSGAQSVHET